MGNIFQHHIETRQLIWSNTWFLYNEKRGFTKDRLAKYFLTEAEAKLRKIIATLLKAALVREGRSGRKSKTTFLPSFPTSVQEDVFDANDE